MIKLQKYFKTTYRLMQSTFSIELAEGDKHVSIFRLESNLAVFLTLKLGICSSQVGLE